MYIIANIMGILYALKRILRAIILNLTTYKFSGLKYRIQPIVKALTIFWP